MANLSGIVQELRKERQRAKRQMEQIDPALAALGNLNSRGQGRRKGHTMSAAARRKIAAAQRARWAKSEGEDEILAREFPDGADCDRRNSSSSWKHHGSPDCVFLSARPCHGIAMG